MKTRIRRMGNSNGVIIPKLMLEEMGIGAGDAVELKLNKKGRLVMAPLGRDPRLAWADECKALAAAGEFGLMREAAGRSNGKDW